MRSSASLPTRLLLSHLLVAVVSIVSLSLFAGTAILNAARNEAENNLDKIVITTGEALEEPLREIVYGEGKILKAQQILLQIANTQPQLHFTVYDIDGTPILDNHDNVSVIAAESLSEEVELAISDELGRGVNIHPNRQGENSIYIARRVENEGEFYGVIRVGVELGPALASTRPLLNVLLLVAAVVTFMATLMAWLLTKTLTRPIQSLTDAANQISLGDLETRVKPVGPLEMRNLAEVFNHMANRLQGYVDELRAFAANASHELRTPLTIVKLRVEALRSGAINDPPVAERFLEEIEGEVDRLARMVTDLLDLSRMEAGLASRKRTKVKLGAVVDDVCATFRIRAERAEVTLNVDKDPRLPTVMGNEDQLHRVLYNLLDNALRYSAKGSSVDVTLKKVDIGNAIRLQVRDYGPGITPDHLPHIFERFYRAEATRPRYGADKTSSGTGLGLAIAKSIVELHGGKIGVSSKFGEGSTFFVELPTTDGD